MKDSQFIIDRGRLVNTIEVNLSIIDARVCLYYYWKISFFIFVNGYCVKIDEKCKKVRDFIVIVARRFSANNILIVTIYSNCINYLRNIKRDDRD